MQYKLINCKFTIMIKFKFSNIIDINIKNLNLIESDEKIYNQQKHFSL